MKTIIALLLLIGTGAAAPAAVNENEFQIQGRYGKPVAKWDDYGGVKKAYRSGGYIITVNFVSGISQMERFMKPDAAQISAEGIGHLLAENSGGRHWQKGTRKDLDGIADIQWESVDKKSRLAFYNQNERVLTVTFPVFLE